jgi:hypothetical protein
MKKVIPIVLATALCVVLLGACVPKNSGVSQASPSVPASASVAASNSPVTAADTTASATESAEPGASPDSVIIAESSNTISDAEKQEVLNNLMGEIDSALGSIDSLEDLDDSDLGTDDIG